MLLNLHVEIQWRDDGSRRYELLDSLMLAGVQVPKHFRSDGPSIPMALTATLWGAVAILAALPFVAHNLFVVAAVAILIGLVSLPRLERYFAAAMVHDYLLVLGTPWKEANRRMCVAMRETGVPWYDRWRVALGIEAGRLLNFIETRS